MWSLGILDGNSTEKEKTAIDKYGDNALSNQ